MAIAGQSTTLRAPSVTRWVIVGLMLIVSMVTYLDRINISIASSQIMFAYGLSAVDMGKSFSAFVFSLPALEIAAGILLGGRLLWLFIRPEKLLDADFAERETT